MRQTVTILLTTATALLSLPLVARVFSAPAAHARTREMAERERSADEGE